jgi:hypothetical protein
MKRSLAVPALAAALLCGGCSQPISPTGPSSVSPGSGLGLAVPGAGAGETAASSQAAPETPFKGSFAGTQSATPLEPPFVFVNGSATGNATHQGLFTVEFPHTVNFVARTGEGTYTFTAANGDTLTADFRGLAQEAPPLISIVEHATVTGGTGRFAGAAGTFTVHRRFNQATGATEGSFEGTMSSVGRGNP